MRLDWTGESVGRRSCKRWGQDHPVPNDRRAFPHLGMENGGSPRKRSRRPGHRYVSTHVNVPTRRLQPTVTGDGVKFESRDILHSKTQPVDARPSALVGTVGWEAGSVLGVGCGNAQSKVYGMGYYWGWMAWDGMGHPWILPRLFCLEGERIRFTWRPLKDLIPLRIASARLGNLAPFPRP